MAGPSPEFISVVAAVVSAVGGAFAAVAAFRSATSARQAQAAAEKSQKSGTLRQLAIAANEVLVEARRAEARTAELKLRYGELFAFAGTTGSSSEGLYLSEVDKKLAEVAQLSDYATPFTSDLSQLANGPLDEISNRETILAQTLTRVRAIREDLEREQASIEADFAALRERALRGSTRL